MAESEWTLATLKEHLVALRADDQRAIQMALDAAERAVAKAEIATERRLEGLNELRGLLSDQQAKFATSEVIDAKFSAFEARLRLVEGANSAAVGRSGLSTSLLVVMASGVAGTIGALIGHFVK